MPRKIVHHGHRFVVELFDQGMTVSLLSNSDAALVSGRIYAVQSRESPYKVTSPGGSSDWPNLHSALTRLCAVLIEAKVAIEKKERKAREDTQARLDAMEELSKFVQG